MKGKQSLTARITAMAVSLTVYTLLQQEPAISIYVSNQKLLGGDGNGVS